MNSELDGPGFTPQALLEFSETGEAEDAICALLTPAMKAKLREIDSGQVLEVRVSDPTAREDILAWSRLSENTVLGMFADGSQRLRFYVRKK